MGTVRLRNINPLGDVYDAAVGRVLAAGEEFEVDESAAGQTATDGNPGYGLLGQLGTNYELVTTPATPAPTPAPDPEPVTPADPAPEG